MSEDDEEKYKILLEHAYEDCKNQDVRKENFDTKTSYMFTFTSVLMGIIIQFIDIGKLVDISVNSLLNCFTLFKLILVGLYIADIILCIIAIFFYVGIINSRPYRKIDTKMFKEKEKIEKMTILEVMQEMTQYYADITINNSKENDKISKKYKCANILILISLCFTIFLFTAIKIIS